MINHSWLLFAQYFFLWHANRTGTDNLYLISLLEFFICNKYWLHTIFHSGYYALILIYFIVINEMFWRQLRLLLIHRFLQLPYPALRFIFQSAKTLSRFSFIFLNGRFICEDLLWGIHIQIHTRRRCNLLLWFPFNRRYQLFNTFKLLCLLFRGIVCKFILWRIVVHIAYAGTCIATIV